MAAFQGKEGPDDAMMNTEGNLATDCADAMVDNPDDAIHDADAATDDTDSATVDPIDLLLSAVGSAMVDPVGNAATEGPTVDTRELTVTEGRCCGGNVPEQTFFTLPLELREEVYKYLLAPAAPGMSICNRTSNAILATNSRIFREANHILRTYWQPRLVFEMRPYDCSQNSHRQRLGLQITNNSQVTNSTYPVRIVISLRALDILWADDPLRPTYTTGWLIDEMRDAIFNDNPNTQEVVIHYDVYGDPSETKRFDHLHGLRHLMGFVKRLRVPKVIIEIHAPGEPEGSTCCHDWAQRVRAVMNSSGLGLLVTYPPGSTLPHGSAYHCEVEVHECA